MLGRLNAIDPTIRGWAKAPAHPVVVALAAVLAMVHGSSPAAAQPAPPIAPQGVTTRQTQQAGPGVGSRSYLLHLPPSSRPAPAAGRPLVVVLHGCTGTAADAEVGTRMSTVADARGWVVLYPEQARATSAGADGEQYGCWNWAKPEHNRRDRGEPWSIAQMVAATKASHPIDASRVHVIGLSAGGAMTVVMAATHPDVFASAASLAGCGYTSCTDTSGSPIVDAMGSHARPVPILVVQGTEDKTVPPSVGQALRRQWVNANDVVDDGEANGSVRSQPDSTDVYTPSGSATTNGSCVARGSRPCMGGSGGLGGGYAYTLDHHADAAGSDMVDFLLVQGLAHAWPGGDPRGSYTDQKGPRVTEGALDFFDEHPLVRAPGRPQSAPKATATTIDAKTAKTTSGGGASRPATSVGTIPDATVPAAAAITPAPSGPAAPPAEAVGPAQESTSRRPRGPLVAAAVANTLVWIALGLSRRRQRAATGVV